MSSANSPLQSIASSVVVLAVAALGLSAGALIAEGAVLVPAWRAQPPADFLAWYSDNASLLVDFFGPLEIVAAALAALAAVLQLVAARPGAGLLGISALLAIAVLAAFPLYFRDVNASFAQGTIVLDRVAGELARWSTWHWGRTVLAVVAFLSGLLALRKP